MVLTQLIRRRWNSSPDLASQAGQLRPCDGGQIGILGIGAKKDRDTRSAYRRRRRVEDADQRLHIGLLQIPPVDVDGLVCPQLFPDAATQIGEQVLYRI